MADDTEKKLNEAENKPKVKLIKKKNDVAQSFQEAEKTPAASTNSASVSAPAKAAEVVEEKPAKKPAAKPAEKTEG